MLKYMSVGRLSVKKHKKNNISGVLLVYLPEISA
jgi:hypothetical protein